MINNKIFFILNIFYIWNKNRVLLYNNQKSISENVFGEINLKSTNFLQNIKNIIKKNEKIQINYEKNKSKNKNLVANISNTVNLPMNYISNLKQTKIILKKYINYSRVQDKNEVLKAIQKNNDLNTCNFIILCEKKINTNHLLFTFIGLFKYSDREKKIIKVYGNEKCPTHILIKNLINNNYYNIYENKIINEESYPKILTYKANNNNFNVFSNSNSIIIYEK